MYVCTPLDGVVDACSDDLAAPFLPLRQDGDPVAQRVLHLRHDPRGPLLAVAAHRPGGGLVCTKTEAFHKCWVPNKVESWGGEEEEERGMFRIKSASKQLIASETRKSRKKKSRFHPHL